ncbi:MAG: hypothetical protein ACI4SO_01530 [Muribaculaceae bacterium]
MSDSIRRDSPCLPDGGSIGLWGGRGGQVRPVRRVRQVGRGMEADVMRHVPYGK